MRVVIGGLCDDPVNGVSKFIQTLELIYGGKGVPYKVLCVNYKKTKDNFKKNYIWVDCNNWFLGAKYCLPWLSIMKHAPKRLVVNGLFNGIVLLSAVEIFLARFFCSEIPSITIVPHGMLLESTNKLSVKKIIFIRIVVALFGKKNINKVVYLSEYEMDNSYAIGGVSNISIFPMVC